MGCLKRRTTSTTDHDDYPNQKKLLASRMTMRIKKDQEIELNRAESKLCQLLNQSVSHLKASSSSTNQDLNSLTLRIAGGWVRDKVRVLIDERCCINHHQKNQRKLILVCVYVVTWGRI
jgi:hypothetical protein